MDGALWGLCRWPSYPGPINSIACLAVQAVFRPETKTQKSGLKGQMHKVHTWTEHTVKTTSGEHSNLLTTFLCFIHFIPFHSIPFQFHPIPFQFHFIPLHSFSFHFISFQFIPLFIHPFIRSSLHPFIHPFMHSVCDGTCRSIIQ